MARLTANTGDRFLSARFSVNDLPSRLRYDVWRDSIACIFDVSCSRALARSTAFHGCIDAYMIGQILFGRTTVSAQHWARSSRTVARDGMDHIMIQFYDRGRQVCETRGREVEMPANSLLVYDLSREMTARSTEMTNLSLILPRALLEDMLDAPDDQHMRVLHGHEPLVGLLREHMVALSRHAARLDVQQSVALAPVTSQLVAACLNGTPRDTQLSSPAVEPALLAALRREIDARLTDPRLDPAALCRRFHLSRSRLYELFSPLGGVSAYIRERRLRGALLALLDPGQASIPVGDIAHRYQFSGSDFSRAFRRRYGMSPRAARHHGLDRIHRDGPPEVDRRYERWLHELVP